MGPPLSPPWGPGQMGCAVLGSESHLVDATAVCPSGMRTWFPQTLLRGTRALCPRSQATGRGHPEPLSACAAPTLSEKPLGGRCGGSCGACRAGVSGQGSTWSRGCPATSKTPRRPHPAVSLPAPPRPPARLGSAGGRRLRRLRGGEGGEQGQLSPLCPWRPRSCQGAPPPQPVPPTPETQHQAVCRLLRGGSPGPHTSPPPARFLPRGSWERDLRRPPPMGATASCVPSALGAGGQAVHAPRTASWRDTPTG